MRALFISIAASLGIMALRAVAQPAGESHDVQRTNATDAALRVWVNNFAASDMPSETQKWEKQIVARGSSIIPVLESWFVESEDDIYRSSVLHLLFEVEGGIPQAVRLVDTELAKDPEQWRGWKWIVYSFNRLKDLDPDKARQQAVRALATSNHWLLVTSALGLLEKIGEPVDIQSIENLISRWQTHDFEDGHRDAVLKIAQNTMSVINTRAHPGTLPLKQAAASVRDHESVAKKMQPQSEPAVARPASTRPSEGSRDVWRWWWPTALLLGIAWLVIVLVRRR